jgi:DNA-binding response OmpR family regulator
MTTTRVLLADPDQGLLESYREFLSQDGFEVATATSGLDCVAKLRSFGPDVLVLEPELPWGQGEGVLAVMSEAGDLPRVPVIALSNRLQPDNLYHVGSLRVSAYYVKPLTPPELKECVRRLCRGRSSFRPSVEEV